MFRDSAVLFIDFLLCECVVSNLLSSLLFSLSFDGDLVFAQVGREERNLSSLSVPFPFH